MAKGFLFFRCCNYLLRLLLADSRGLEEAIVALAQMVEYYADRNCPDSRQAPLIIDGVVVTSKIRESLFVEVEDG